MTDSLTPPEPDSPAPIAPVVESATPTQQRAAIAVAAGQVPERVQLADKVGEAIGIIVLGTLAWHRPELGTLACWLIAGIVSGGTLTRTLGPRVGLPALGAAGLTLLSLGSVLSELTRGAGRGRATAHQLAGALILVCLLGAFGVPLALLLLGGLR